jgi:excisionase family DNA binding protein
MTLLSIRDVALRLNVHPSTVAVWVRNGRLSGAVKFGQRTVRVPLSAVEAFVGAGAIAPNDVANRP